MANTTITEGENEYFTYRDPGLPLFRLPVWGFEIQKKLLKERILTVLSKKLPVNSQFHFLCTKDYLRVLERENQKYRISLMSKEKLYAIIVEALRETISTSPPSGPCENFPLLDTITDEQADAYLKMTGAETGGLNGCIQKFFRIIFRGRHRKRRNAAKSSIMKIFNAAEASHYFMQFEKISNWLKSCHQRMNVIDAPQSDSTSWFRDKSGEEA